MKYCAYCGAGLEQDMRFCPNCGKPFAEGKTNPYISENAQPERKTIEVASAPSKPKMQGKVFALIAVLVLVAIGVGIFAFMPKEEPAIPFIDDTDAIAQAAQSVVMLSCYDKEGELYSTGSGFAIFDNGVILTNYHVIEQEVYQVKAQTESGMTFECPTVLAYDAEKDISILKADRETGLTLLPAGNATELQKGAKVVAIGSPLGLINSVSTGVFSGYIDYEFGSMLQFTAAISHGSSGGALFNDAGEVIGITFDSYNEGQNLNMAVPIDDAKALYDYAGSQKQMSIEEFYDTFDHTPPIPTYTVGYVLENYSEIDGQEFFLEGYLSTIQAIELENGVIRTRIYLVNSQEEVAGYTFILGDYSVDIMKYMEEIFKEDNKVEIFKSLEVDFYDEIYDWLEPKDKLLIRCQLNVLEDYVDGRKVWGGHKLDFTPYEIAVIE